MMKCFEKHLFDYEFTGRRVEADDADEEEIIIDAPGSVTEGNQQTYESSSDDEEEGHESNDPERKEGKSSEEDRR